MVKAAVFASGSGTNFEEICKHVQDGSLPIDLQMLICDKEDAYALQRAKKFGVDAFVFKPKEYSGKEAYEQAILQLLRKREVDLIILSGYMRYIGKVLLEAYPNRIINIHPAYLPEFPGAHGIADAYNAGVSQTGVTIHFVDEGVDTGPIIAQERVPIDPAWDLEELEAHVHAKEYDLFWRTIKQVAESMEEGKI